MFPLAVVTVFVPLAGGGLPGPLPNLPTVGLLPVPSPPLLGKPAVSTHPYFATRLSAVRELDRLVTTIGLYRELLDRGQWDVISVFNVAQIYCQVAAAAVEVYGETAELVPWYEARVAAVRWAEAVVARGLAAGTVRRSDVDGLLPGGKLRERVERPLIEIKTRLGQK